MCDFAKEKQLKKKNKELVATNNKQKLWMQLGNMSNYRQHIVTYNFGSICKINCTYHKQANGYYDAISIKFK